MNPKKIKDDSIFSDYNSEEFWVIMLLLTLLGLFICGMTSIMYNEDGRNIGKKEAYNDAIKAGVAYEEIDENGEDGIIKWY